MGWFFPDTDPKDVAAYQNASSDHDQAECGGTWRAHSDPQERLDCIKTSIKTSDKARGSWWRR